MKPSIISLIVLAFFIKDSTCISLDETNSYGELKNNKKFEDKKSKDGTNDKTKVQDSLM